MATSAGSGSGENRLKSYKTKGFTLEESRKKREEEGIQLRKSKRDEQVRRHDYYVFECYFILYFCSYPSGGIWMQCQTLWRLVEQLHSLSLR